MLDLYSEMCNITKLCINIENISFEYLHMFCIYWLQSFDNFGGWVSGGEPSPDPFYFQ